MPAKGCHAQSTIPKTTENRGVRNTTISRPAIEKQGATAVTSIAFRVTKPCRCAFKLHHVKHGISMVDVLQPHEGEAP